MSARVGIVGLGFIGAAVAERVLDGALPGVELAFVHDRDATRTGRFRGDLRLASLDGFAARGANLVVECAGPDVTERHGLALVGAADYLPLSVGALVDDELRERLVDRARTAGTRLLVPHGALPGAEALVERADAWAEVTITFRKHPRHWGLETAAIEAATVLYDGPVRGVARRFPRNVNAMVACALATVGLDRCRAVVVADPQLELLVAEVEAVGHDGSSLSMVKRQPGVGVSGTEMVDAVARSIACATGLPAGLALV